MRRSIYFISLLCVMLTYVGIMPLQAQEKKQYAVFNYRNDGLFNAFLNYEIDSITYSCIDTLGIEHDDVVVQEVWTPDSVYRIPLNAIDSLSFRAPETKMRDDLFYIRDYHADYTSSIDSLTLYFTTAISADSLPAVGQVMLNVTKRAPFEEGFAGRVREINRRDGRIEVVCMQVNPCDVFERFVAVGMGVTDLADYKAKRKAKGSGYWEEYETNGDIEEIELPEEWKYEWNPSFLDILSFKSKNPRVRYKYYALVSLWDFYVQGDIFVNHDNLTVKVNFDWDKIAKLGDEYKELKEIWELFKEGINTGDFDPIRKKEKDKALEEKEWGFNIPIPFQAGPFSCIFELGVMMKPDAWDLKADWEMKTAAFHHLGFHLSGYTTPIAQLWDTFDLSFEEAAEKWDADWNHTWTWKPCTSFNADVKIDGSLTFGCYARLKASLLTKYLLHATVGAEAGIKFSYSGEFTLKNSEYDVRSVYDRLKNTQLGMKCYVKGKAEAGALPFDLINLSNEVEIPIYEVKAYLFPKFTKPSLTTDLGYDRKWNETFTSTISGDLIPFLSYKPGLAFYYDQPRTEWATIEAAYFDQNPFEFGSSDRDVQFSAYGTGLRPGVNYRCYPVLKMFGMNIPAGPYTEFTYPKPLSMEIPSLLLQKDDFRTVRINGGWGDYTLDCDKPDVVKATMMTSGNFSQVQINALKAGTATVTVKDKRSRETETIELKVFDGQGGNASITVSESTIDFGNVAYGIVDTKTFKVTNHGSDELAFIVDNDQTNISNGFVVDGAGHINNLKPGESQTMTVTAKGIGPGHYRKGTIYIRSNATTDPVPVALNVNGKATSVEYVDLGLSVKWAECNLGALEAMGGSGDYFAWGETESKPSYGWDNYIHCDGTADTCHPLGNISGTDYDAAHYQWGGKWRMPTADELKELKEKCSWTWDTSMQMVGGLPGYRVTGPNGNSIFLETAGIMNGTEVRSANVGSLFFSGTPSEDLQYAYVLGFENDKFYLDEGQRFCGASIRPVYDDNMQGLQLSATSLTLTPGSQGTVDVVSGSGNYAVKSSDTNVATATREGAKVTITAVAVGTATITVKDQQTNVTADIQVTVSDGQSTIVVNPQKIDFGEVESGSSGLRYLIISNNGEQVQKVTINTGEIDDGLWRLEDPTQGSHGRWDSYNIVEKNVQPGENALFTLRFYPTVIGDYHCNLTVTTESVDGWKHVIPVSAKCVEVFEDKSFHLSTNSVDTYENIEESVEIYYGSGEYDVINDYPDIVQAHIIVTNKGYAPAKKINRVPADSIIAPEWDYLFLTGKKVGHATLKIRDKKTNETITLNVEVKRTPSISLSLHSIELGVDEYNPNIEILSGSGSYSTTSNNPEIATVSYAYNRITGVDDNGIAQYGTFITISGLKVGNTIVTVTDNSSGETADIQVTVKGDDIVSYLTCPDDHHPHLIDLGLPDGTWWACCNVDATKPEDYGGNYAWGETETKTSYSYENYQYAYIDDNDKSGDCPWFTHHYWHCKDLGDSICGTDYDVAYVKSGNMWHMPTIYNFQTLKKYCSYEHYKMNGIEGLLFVGKNGGSIFMPYTDIEYNEGQYWTANPCPKDMPRIGTPSKNCSFSCQMYSSALDYINEKDDNRRYEGKSIRPVYDSHIPPLYLSTSTLNLTPGSQVTVDITCGSGSYEAVSSSTSVATVTVEGSELIIKAGALGSATITVRDNQTQKREKIEITVTNLSCPDDHHPHLIDLGLPSGTKWACCNVDEDHTKQSPTNYGSYYAWGEIQGEDYYDWSTYQYSDADGNCQSLGSDISGTQYDVVHYQWGGSWVMPSFDQIKELLDNCPSEWMTLSGVNGRRFTGNNGGIIFLPAAGNRWHEDLTDVGSEGRYWSSTQHPSYSDCAYDLYFYSGYAYWQYYSGRYVGHPVRPVSR